jgi:hypothetical protein
MQAGHNKRPEFMNCTAFPGGVKELNFPYFDPILIS